MKQHQVSSSELRIYGIKALTEDYHSGPSNLEKELKNEVLWTIYFWYKNGFLKMLLATIESAATGPNWAPLGTGPRTFTPKYSFYTKSKWVMRPRFLAPFPGLMDRNGSPRWEL